MSLEIVDLLMRLNQEGTTVIMVTHEHNLVRMYDKRVILLENGTVAADGRMKNSAHRERTLAKSSSLNRPADGFATKYLDDEEEAPEEKVAAKEPERLPEKEEAIRRRLSEVRRPVKDRVLLVSRGYWRFSPSLSRE